MFLLLPKEWFKAPQDIVLPEVLIQSATGEKGHQLLNSMGIYSM